MSLFADCATCAISFLLVLSTGLLGPSKPSTIFELQGRPLFRSIGFAPPWRFETFTDVACASAVAVVVHHRDIRSL